MIRCLEHSSIDKTKWDACIRRSPGGMIYAHAWYLDMVSPGWQALVEGDYESIFPLTWRKKFGWQYLYQPYFTQQLGIFSAGKQPSAQTVSDFLAAIPPRFKLVEIQLNSGNTFHMDAGFTINERLTHHLDLSQPYEKIVSGYSQNLKRNIKEASAHEIELRFDADVSAIIQLLRQNKGAEISNLGDNDYRMAERIMHEAAARKLLTVIAAYHEGKLCAGAVFLQSDHEYIFFFSATNEEARKTNAMSRIVDYFIRLHSAEEMKLDFEGSMDKNLARYYKSFGSKEVVYLQIRRNTLPAYARWIKK